MTLVLLVARRDVGVSKGPSWPSTSSTLNACVASAPSRVSRRCCRSHRSAPARRGPDRPDLCGDAAGLAGGEPRRDLGPGGALRHPDHTRMPTVSKPCAKGTTSAKPLVVPESGANGSTGNELCAVCEPCAVCESCAICEPCADVRRHPSSKPIADGGQDPSSDRFTIALPRRRGNADLQLRAEPCAESEL